MAQEEGEILEYYKMMEIEKPRPRKILATPINMTQKYIGKVCTQHLTSDHSLSKASGV
jgi:hypothetical protein